MMKAVPLWVRGVLVLATLMLAGAAFAQDFPSKPIRLVLPYGTIGLPDILARLVAAKMSESMGQPVIVDNKPGAGGSIAYQFAAKAAPHGHTVLLASDADYAITPALNPKLPYDPGRDFTTVTQAIRGTFFLVANSSLGVNSVRELIALAKTRPGINYGSPGSGQTHHLAMAQFALMAGVNLTHVPYKGVAQATPALLSGDVSIMFVTLPSVLSHVKAGKLRILAAGSSQRSPLMPDVPTVAESGYPGYNVTIWWGIAAPQGMPKARMARLLQEINAVLDEPATKKWLLSYAASPINITQVAFRKQIHDEIIQWKKVARQANILIK